MNDVKEVQPEYLYQIVTPNGVSICTAKQLKERFIITRFESRKCVRDELYGQPKLDGFNGPMWNGIKDGMPVIRYES